jgi:hypothetical protein
VTGLSRQHNSAKTSYEDGAVHKGIVHIISEVLVHGQVVVWDLRPCRLSLESSTRKVKVMSEKLLSLIFFVAWLACMTDFEYQCFLQNAIYGNEDVYNLKFNGFIYILRS